MSPTKKQSLPASPCQPVATSFLLRCHFLLLSLILKRPEEVTLVNNSKAKETRNKNIRGKLISV